MAPWALGLQCQVHSPGWPNEGLPRGQGFPGAWLHRLVGVAVVRAGDVGTVQAQGSVWWQQTQVELPRCPGTPAHLPQRGGG